jgi:hypothetical protein
MKDFLKKINKFGPNARRLKMICGGVALVAMLAVFIGTGIPRTAYAWVIYIYPFTYTPVTTGGYSTISWHAPTSDTCTLMGPYTPCYSGGGGIGGKLAPGGVPLCMYSARGADGSYRVGPITGPTSYNIYCHNVSGGWGSSEGNGQNSLTVYPTPPASPTTLSSFSANPSAVANGAASTLSWSGTKGTNFSSCQLTGGQWGSAGAWFTALPGSVTTAALTTTTTYSFNCFDTTGAAAGARSATVTVAPPVVPEVPPVPDACTNIAGNQASAPANGTASGGTCACNSGFTLSGDTCVANAVDVCSNIAGTQSAPPANGSVSGSTCACNSGYTLQGSSCVAVPVCSGAHQTGTPPNCTCEVGFQWQGSSCVQATCAGQNEVNPPTCSCAAGFTRNTVTNTCIRPAVLDIKVNGLDSTRVRKGNSVTVTWSATGIVTGSCQVTANTGTTIGSGPSGSVSTTVGSQTTYRLGCQNEAGSGVSKEANVTLIPEVNEQ